MPISAAPSAAVLDMGDTRQDKPDILDAPLLRVPFEGLKRAAKDRKALVDEASEALDGLAAAAGSPAAQQLAALDQALARLQGLKRKLQDVGRQEADEALRVKARLEHLSALGPAPGQDGVVAWNRRRLDRMLVDHMLRTGHHASADRLANETGSAQLTDGHIFDDARRVVDSLQRHDAGPALEWCDENRSRLRKIKSSLEFKLRLQEFLELVRQERRLDAVAYARRHLAPWAAGHMRELQRALGTLAFAAPAKVSPYKPLFSDAAWAGLLELFYRELFRLHCLLPESMLTLHLQAGLVALKTPPSSAGPPCREDPLAQPDYAALAERLPYAKHVRSKLICAVTRELMNDANPPMVLPNGYVYSQKALQLLAARHGGRVVCPRTGAAYAPEEARRAFIV